MALEVEMKIWDETEELRELIGLNDYVGVISDLLFFKYVSDKYENKKKELLEAGKDCNDKNNYDGVYIIFIPEAASWNSIKENTRCDFCDENGVVRSFGQLLDNAFTLIEKEYPQQEGIFFKLFTGLEIDRRIVREVFDLIDRELYLGDQDLEYLSRSLDFFMMMYRTALKEEIDP